MGQVLHGSATTTEAVRRATQHSQESLRTLAARYGTNPENRRQVEGQIVGFRCPNWTEEPSSIVLSREEEAAIVAFRKLTLLPLDDCPCVRQPTIRI